MQQIVILTRTFFYNPALKKISIGGVETYIRELAKTCQMAGFKVVVCQKSPAVFSDVFDGITVEGVVSPGKNQFFYKKVRRKYGNSAFYIIDSDQEDIRAKEDNVVVIQHGIAFDGPLSGKGWLRFTVVRQVVKLLKVISNIRRSRNVRHMVCVDYNYFNWIRTVSWLQFQDSIRVIPNFTSSVIERDALVRKLEKDARKRIIFARRFVDYRGTLLFAEVTDKLIRKYPYLQITFAGDGPLGPMLKEKYRGIENVLITSFSAEDSVDFHTGYDIAVVPTLYSEGTSLALCEAMAAGCYPVATHVGGMTNMLIHQYNGSLVFPSGEAIYKEIDTVLQLPEEEFYRRVEHAWETARYSFCLEKWRESWVDYLRFLTHN